MSRPLHHVLMPLVVRHPDELTSANMRLRDDTFHYARDKESVGRMREAMGRAGSEQGSYLVTDRALRAEYADLLRVYLAHPFEGTDEETEAQAREMHQAIVDLIAPLSNFLHVAEAHWLDGRRPSKT